MLYKTPIVCVLLYRVKWKQIIEERKEFILRTTLMHMFYECNNCTPAVM